MGSTRRETAITTGQILTGYMFNDDELLWEAVQASGSNVAHIYPEGNKRLAMIGDVVLKLVVLEDLRPQNMNRGMDNHSYTANYLYLSSIYAKRNYRFHGHYRPENCQKPGA